MKPERRNRSPKLSVCWIGQCFNRVRRAVRARGWDCFRLRTESLALATINMSWRSTSLFVVTSRHGPTIERMLLKEHEVARLGTYPHGQPVRTTSPTASAVFQPRPHKMSGWLRNHLTYREVESTHRASLSLTSVFWTRILLLTNICASICLHPWYSLSLASLCFPAMPGTASKTLIQDDVALIQITPHLGQKVRRDVRSSYSPAHPSNRLCSPYHATPIIRACV